jgi:hypothetical protein
MVGIPAFFADVAATALKADKAITEPRATHETFDHDVDIGPTFMSAFEPVEKPNAISAIRYNKSNVKTNKYVEITFTRTI